MTDDKDANPMRKYPSAPLVGVGAVAIKNGNILLVKRAFEPGAGKWSIPGGLVELGEKLSEACAREMEEETGIEIEVLELINVFDMVDRDDSGKVMYHYVLVDFLARPTGGEEKLSAEVTEMKWVTREEARKMDLTRTARKVIEELFGGAGAA
ncbi:MAG: NUDIX hydrolase [Thermoplasmatota archaeon]